MMRSPRPILHGRRIRGVIPILLAGETCMHLGVEVIGPYRVGAELRHYGRSVPLVSEEDATTKPVSKVRELAKNVRLRRNVDGMRGVESEPVESKLLEPVPRVRKNQVPHGPAGEVGRSTPRRANRFVEMARGVPMRVIPGRTTVAVDDIEEYGDSTCTWAWATNARRSSGGPYAQCGAKRATPSYAQPRSPPNAATGITSIASTPSWRR